MRQAAAALAVVILAAGCGGSKHAAKPPTPQELVRGSLLAAARSDGGRYVLDVRGSFEGLAGAPLPGSLRLHLAGAVGRDGVTALVSATPKAAVPAHEIRAAPEFAYVRYARTWYGNPTRGLDGFWPELPRLLVPPERLSGSSVRVPTEDDLLRLLEGAIDGTIAAGPQIGGDSTWELAGTLDPHAIASLLHALVGDLPVTALEPIVARSHAVYDVGVDDELPRRLRIDLHFVRADLPAEVRNQVRDFRSVSVHADLALSHWGEKPVVERPAHARSFDDYLNTLGLGG